MNGEKMKKNKFNELMRNMFLILIVGFLFLIMSFNNFSIFAIQEEISLENNGEKIIVTQDLASEAISNSEKIIADMVENNFSVIYMEDILLEAKRVFEQVQFAEIIRDPLESGENKQEARKALRLIDWKEITYGDVLVQTDLISERKDEALILFDSILLDEKRIKNYEEKGLDVIKAKIFLAELKIAFSEERYADAQKSLEDIRNELEIKRQESSTLGGLKSGAQNFIFKNWKVLLGTLLILIIIFIFFYNIIKRKILKNKIEKLKAQKITLNRLMKKTQFKRFKENKLSALIYNIRMKNYKDKLTEIDEQLPVFEGKLKGKRFKE